MLWHLLHIRYFIWRLILSFLFFTQCNYKLAVLRGKRVNSKIPAFFHFWSNQDNRDKLSFVSLECSTDDNYHEIHMAFSRQKLYSNGANTNHYYSQHASSQHRKVLKFYHFSGSRLFFTGKISGDITVFSNKNNFYYLVDLKWRIFSFYLLLNSNPTNVPESPLFPESLFLSPL